MKRLGHIWEDVLDKDNALVAIMEGTEKKRGDRAVQRFLYSDDEIAVSPNLYHQIDPKRAEPYIETLTNDLRTGKWKHGKPFYKRIVSKNRIHDGKAKVRDIYVPNFRDHIVHHMIIQSCMQAFSRGMHPHCCGSVKGRGTKHVVETGKKWFTKDKDCRYFVKLDIRKFFDSIDPELLMQVIERKIKDKYVLDVIRQIVYSAPSACPVGYYTSPIFANLFLEDFDWFVEQKLYKVRRGKRIKYVRHYMRYIDDLLLMGNSRSDLKKAVVMITDYLKTKGLSIKQSWEIKRIGEHEFRDGKWCLKKGTYWCDFVGYKFCSDAVIPRDGIFLAARRLAKRMYKREYYTIIQCQSINARLAWACHCCYVHFFMEIMPYINIKETRRIISYVSKKREWRIRQTGCA